MDFLIHIDTIRIGLPIVINYDVFLFLKVVLI